MKSRKHPSLWLVTGIQYAAYTAMPTGGATYYIPEKKRTGTLGVDLFERQMDAQRAADANLTRMAEEHGVSSAVMSDRIRAELDPAWQGAR